MLVFVSISLLRSRLEADHHNVKLVEKIQHLPKTTSEILIMKSSLSHLCLRYVLHSANLTAIIITQLKSNTLTFQLYTASLEVEFALSRF